MLVKISRQSVCLGDDMMDNSIEIEIYDNDKFTDIIKKLESMNFFPSMNPYDIAWVLICNGEDLVTYLPKDNIICTRFVTNDEPIINSVPRWKNKEIFFRYYSSYINRAKHIFDMHNGKKFHIWHEGFMREYETYNIESKLELQWLEELKKEKENNEFI